MVPMEIYQVPLLFRCSFRAKKFVSMGLFVLVALLMLLIGIIGGFDDLWAAVIVSCICLGYSGYLVFIGWYYDRKCSSKIRILDKQIQVICKDGTCCRMVAYENVTDVRVEEIYGCFYGEDRDEVKQRYICLFLNGLTEIPDVEYNKLYKQADFLIMAYDEDAYSTLVGQINSV